MIMAGSRESWTRRSRRLPNPYWRNISIWFMRGLDWISFVAAVAKTRCQKRHIFSRKGELVMTMR